MRSIQSKVSPTLSDELVITEEGGNQFNFQANTPSPSESKEKMLHKTVLSLSHKLDELVKISDEVFRTIDSAGSDFNPGSFRNDDSSSGVSAPEVSPLSHPAYQIFSLMRLLQSPLNFTHWGVFLLNEGISGSMDSSGDIQEVVSSQSFEEDGHSKDFEKEVKAQYACGNITQSITGKKRMSFPSERGNLLVIPFRLSNGKDGFWAMKSEKGILVPWGADEELLLWGVDLIVTCMENVRGSETSSSAIVEKTTTLEREKLFSLIQLSRAMVHEVNNSLQIILGRAQIARMNQSKTPQNHTNSGIWETIEKNASRICTILKNFSDFLHRQSDAGADPSAQKPTKNHRVFPTEVNLHHILESDLALLQYILGSAGIELELKDVSGLPSVCGKPEETELTLLSLIWGIKDVLTSGGYLQIQPSANEEGVCLDLIWREKTKNMDVPSRALEFHDNPRFRLVSQFLQNSDQSLKFEMTDAGERKITWNIPVVPK